MSCYIKCPLPLPFKVTRCRGTLDCCADQHSDGNAEIARLDIDGLDNDGQMYGQQLTELKLQNFIP